MTITRSRIITKGKTRYAEVEIWNDNVSQWFTFEFQMFPGETLCEIADAYIDKSGAYWATRTAEQIERIHESTARLIADCAIWGCD